MIALEKGRYQNLEIAPQSGERPGRGLPWMEGATAGSNRSRRLVGTNTDHPPGRKVEDSCPGAPPSSGSPLEPERT